MKTTYITFTQEMARAYREGRKRMARRVIKPQPRNDIPSARFVFDGERWCYPNVCAEIRLKCPYGQSGDHLILGTTWATLKNYDGMKPTQLGFGAPIWSYFDGNEKPEGFGRLRPGRFLPVALRDRMPRETLTFVRAERVQEITLDDIYAEGAITEEWEEWREDAECVGLPPGSHIENELDVFEGLWDSINLKRGYGWESNPRIWVLGW